jgi:D-3-phosphoglycerate dehydrogenase
VLVVQNRGFPFHVVDSQVLNRASRLRLIQHYGVSYDGTDIEAAKSRGTLVATTANTNSQSVAEVGFHLLLSVAKRSRLAEKSLRRGRMGEFLCTELAGKTLCLVGFGRIGKILARMAKAIPMTVVAVKRTPDIDEALSAGADAIVAVADLHKALAVADFVLLALPLTAESFNLIDAPEFAVMKKGACLINISRGPHVNRQSLERSLASGRLAGYAADVYWDEPAPPEDAFLLDDRVIVTPHIGADSREAIDRMARAVRENVDRLVRGEPLRNVVAAASGADRAA